MDIDRTYIDHLYGQITIEDDLFRLINRAEVKEYIIRLQNLSQLGIISKIFLLGRHSKWEHSVGLYHLACEIFENHKLDEAGLEIHRPSFKAAALLHGIGHLPISYPSELAIVYIYKRDRRKCRGLVQKFKSVQRIICNDCDKSCWERILEEERAGELVRWLTSSILLKARDWFRKQRTFKHHEILRYLVCEKKPGYHLLWDLDLLDYTQRDLFYLGTAQVALNLKHLFSNITLLPREARGRVKFPDEWTAVQSLSRYLNESIYRHRSVVAAESSFAKVLAEMVFSGELYLTKLHSISDDDLLKKIDSTSRSAFGGRVKHSKLIDDIRASIIERYLYVDVAFFHTLDPGLFAETQLMNESFEKWISYPKYKGMLIRIETIDREYDYNRVDILWDSKAKKGAPFLEVLESLEKELSFTYENFRQPIVEWLFGKEESPFIDYQRYYPVVYPQVKRLVGRKKNPETILNFFIGDSDFRDWLAYSELRGYENYDKDDWIAEIFRIFMEYPVKFKPKIWNELIRNLPGNDDRSPELDAYLKACKSLSDPPTWGYAVPSLHLRGDNICEIDLVVLQKKNTKRYEIMLNEYSRSRNPTKKDKDQEKLRGVRAILSSRFQSGITVKLRYNGVEFN